MASTWSSLLAAGPSAPRPGLGHTVRSQGPGSLALEPSGCQFQFMRIVEVDARCCPNVPAWSTRFCGALGEGMLVGLQAWPLPVPRTAIERLLEGACPTRFLQVPDPGHSVAVARGCQLGAFQRLPG